MSVPLQTLQEQVLAQKTLISSLYGDVGFSIVPERFASGIADKSLLPPQLRSQIPGRHTGGQGAGSAKDAKSTHHQPA